MGFHDDENRPLFYTTLFTYLLLGLAWCAVQVFSIVQGARFLSTTFCNEDLAIYLLISGILIIALVLVAGAAPYVQARYYNGSSKLTTKQLQYRAPPRFDPQETTDLGTNYLRWRPPRSTCHQVHTATGCAVRHYIDLEDQLPPFPGSQPGSTDQFVYQRDTWICQQWAQQCWRQLYRNHALNGLYSPVPITSFTRSPEARSAWKCLKRLVYALEVLLALAYVGWLIFGTVMTSKSGVGRCDTELYRTALAIVIINWSSPFVALILTAFALFFL